MSSTGLPTLAGAVVEARTEPTDGPVVVGEPGMLSAQTLPPDMDTHQVVLEMDLAESGVALDLSSGDWAANVLPALTALYGDLDPGAAIGQLSEAVCARAATLALEGASSLLLVATGNDVAPIAVGAVFVHAAVSASLESWRKRLEPDGWHVWSTCTPGVASVRGSRVLPIPGAAGLQMAEQLLVIPTAVSVFLITFHAVETEVCPSSQHSAVARLLANITIRDLSI